MFTLSHISFLLGSYTGSFILLKFDLEYFMDNLFNPAIVTLFCALFIVIVKILANKYNKYKLNKTIKLIDSPFYSSEDIQRATRYYINSRWQAVSPTSKDEPKLAVNPSEPVIPFFLSIGFLPRERGDNFYLVLADSGMGKTTLMINLFLAVKRKRRFSKLNIKLVHLGDKGWEESVTSTKEQPSTILLLDAFDENAGAVANYTSQIHYISDLVCNFHTVVLTSRSQFFPSEKDEPYELPIRSDSKYYCFKKMYLSPFSDKDISSYLNKKYGLFRPWNYSNKILARDIINKSPLLMVRPMLLSFIDDLLAVNSKIEYTIDIYELMIDKWIEREANRVHNERRDTFMKYLHNFSYELAMYIYNKRLDMIQNQNPNIDLFIVQSQEITQLALDNNINLDEIELKSRSLLNRNAHGEYKFAHKSFLEYLIAKWIFVTPNEIYEFNTIGLSQTNNFLEEFVAKHGITMSVSKRKSTYKSTYLDNHTFLLERLNPHTEDELMSLLLHNILLDREYPVYIPNNLHERIFNIHCTDTTNDDNTITTSYNLQYSQYLPHSIHAPYSLPFILSMILRNAKSVALPDMHIEELPMHFFQPNLVKLDYSNNLIDNIVRLSTLVNLTWLDLSHNIIESIAPIENLVNISTLKLGYNRISDISPLSELKSIKHLELNDNRIDSLYSLRFNTSIEFIDLSNNSISHISNLRDFPVTSLILSNNNITDISPLESCRKLQYLDLSSNRIADITPLLNLPQLAYIDVSNNPVKNIELLNSLNTGRQSDKNKPFSIKIISD